jgi:cell division protein FtsZ
MGTGEARGDNRAINAAEQAINNPLLDEAMKGARGLIISISGGDDLRLMEVDEVANHVKELVDPEADIIWGSAFNPALEGAIRVSIVATGVDAPAAPLDAVAPVTFAQLATARAPSPVPAPELAPVTVIQAISEVAETARAAPALTVDPASPSFYLAERARLAASASVPAPIAIEATELASPPAEWMSDEELLLTVERALVLTPPDNVSDIATIDPFAAEPMLKSVQITADSVTPPAPSNDCARGPSLFERMAMLAKGTVKEFRGAKGPPLPNLYRGRDYDGGPTFLDRRNRLAA